MLHAAYHVSCAESFFRSGDSGKGTGDMLSEDVLSPLGHLALNFTKANRCYKL